MVGVRDGKPEPRPGTPRRRKGHHVSTALVRTDPHTLRHLRPEDYRFVAAFDNEPERDCDYYLDDPDRHSLAMDIAAQIGNAPQIAEHWRARLAAEAMPDGHWNRSGGGRCDHCGARPRYVAVLRHLPTGQLLPVGETCLDNRFGDDAVEHLDRLRGQAVARRERVSWRMQRTAWLSADPRHVEAITYLHARVKAADLPVSRFADSVASFWDRPSTTHLTPRQVEALLEMRDREAAAVPSRPTAKPRRDASASAAPSWRSASTTATWADASSS